MSMEEKIRATLEAAFQPEHLEIINDSALHLGHMGDDGSGESHFRVAIRARAFADMTRLARHRAVHAALGQEIIGRIHALALEIEA